MSHDTDTPAVTVIVPVYNSVGTLERAIRSVLSQTFENFEVLVIDDGSNDGSLDIARSLQSGEPRIAVHPLPCNGGKPRAMNHGIGLARGRWIAVLDADDRYLPHRLATLIGAAEAHGVDLVADNQLHSDPVTGALVRQAFLASGDGRTIDLSDFIAHSDTGGTFDFGILKPVVRAEFIRRTKLAYHPDARLAEDFYYLLQFFAAGGRGWLVHEPLYEWNLPFSPAARRWTNTGAGAWRYDYRNALAVNRHFLHLYSERPDIEELLRRREREYGVMVNYLDAQRALAESGDVARAIAIIATHPGTWKLLARRITGRIARRLGARRRTNTAMRAT